MATFEIKNIKKSFGGVHAVNGISFVLQPKTITSLIGPNGSGKTTLTNLVSGVIPLDAGAVTVNGNQQTKIRDSEIAVYGITRTFQNVRVIEQMTVLENILLVLTERNVFGALFERHKDYHLKQAEDVLQKMDLWKKRDENAENLSYGQRKLLEIARVLAMKSDIYLFDEPFAGLFSEMRRIVIHTLKKLRSEGKTILLIEHNMDLIRELSDHVIVMDAGTLLAEGKPEEVLGRKDVVEAYLGE